MRVMRAPRPEGAKRRKKRVFYNPYSKKIELMKHPVRRKEEKVEATGYFQPDDKPLDNKWVGDIMDNEADKKVTRFLFNNCHGLDFNKSDSNYMKSKIQAYLSTGAHYIGLAETGINIRKAGNMQKTNEAFREVLDEGMITLNHGKSIGESDFQWGGVGTITYGRLHQRWMKNEKDDHGRWIMQKFFGEQKNLCIYTLYRVNHGDNSKGGSVSAWSQQQYSLGLKGITEDPRKRVIRDLLKDINTKQKEGNAIILMADLNEGMDSREKTNDKSESMGLINVMSHKLEDKLPNTYKHGSSTIDHVWATGDICAHITKIGISPFNYPAFSDHRSLVFDLDMKQILDADYLFLSSFIGRTLKMSMPERVEKYGEEMIKQWKYHKIEDKYKRIQMLFKKRGPIRSNVKKLNKLDKQITEMMLCAERKCSRIGRKPTVPWSPKIHAAVQKIYQAGYDRRMARKMLKAGDSDSINKYTAAKEAYKEAKVEYKELRKVSANLREEFLDKRIKLLQEQRREFQDKPKIKILKILKHREKQRDDARKINYVLQKQMKAGLSSILIPSEDDYPNNNVDIYDIPTIWKRLQIANGKDIKRWIRVTDRATMERLLAEWQKYHFMQANETPFASKEWEEYLAAEETQNNILEGRFVISEKYPPECQLMFSCMKKETKVTSNVNCTTSYSEFINYIKRADETTSASPSGRTYSHYKALLSEVPRILKYIHGLFSLALQHKVVLQRWSTTITTLILKDSTPQIHRMRTIHIVEAELQFISKITYAQRMMSKAEKEKILTDEQYGGRKQRQALSVVINKLLYYAITTQQLTRAAFMDDDARACYDRIIPHLAEVETQKWGVERDTAKMTTEILKSQEFHIRTSHGIAQTTYTNHGPEKTHGAGQGLGWSGPLWTCSSDTISKALNKTCVGMTFQSLDGDVKVEKCGDYFVDDTATGVTENNVRAEKTVLEELGQLEQTHAFLMFAEGHKIAFDKCSFYNVDFEREKNGHRLKRIDECPGELLLKEGFEQQPKNIKRLECTEAHKTLGHYISVDGSNEKQAQQIRNKVHHWNKCITASGLSNETKMLAYNGWLVPALKYKILSCNLTYDECDEIMRIVQPTLLHAHNIARTCSRIVLHASTKLAGLNIYHLYQLQGLEKLKFFLWHFRKMDTTGKLLQITMEYTQLELGVSRQFFQLNYERYNSFTTKTWVTSIWQYLDSCKAKAQFTQQKTYSLPREGDRYLMDVLFEHQLDKDRLMKFNQIRLKLKILSLSDMVEVGSRIKILDRVKQGQSSRASRWGWPAIREIPDKWINIWKNVIDTIVAPYLRVCPLGRWKGISHQLWDGTTNCNRTLLWKNGNMYGRKWQDEKFIRYDGESEVRECIYPADLGANLTLISSGRLSQEKQETPKVQGFLEHFRTLEYWERRNIGDNAPDEEMYCKVAKLIQEGNFLAISDGSYKNGRASHAWCIANSNTKEKLIVSAGPVDGPLNEMSAFRAEAMGLLAILSILGILEENGVVGEKKVVIQLDCKSLLTKVKSLLAESIKHIEENDMDVIHEIRARIKKMKTKLRIEHVKGHQDDDEHYDNLSFTAQINVDVDAAAKKLLRDLPIRFTPTATYPILPAQQIVIFERNTVILQDLRMRLNDSWIKCRWESYMSNVLKIKKEDIDKVNLRPITQYLRENRPSAGSVAKIIHQQINTFETCYRWRTSTTEICPLCKIDPETPRHILSCTFPPLQQSRNSSIQNIHEALGQIKTAPKLKAFLKEAINSFAVDYPLKSPPLSVDPDDIWLHRIHKSQNNIGWNNFYRGYITIHMEQMQREHLAKNGDATPFLSAQQWSRSLARLVITHFRTAWRQRCDALALLNDHTLEKRRREMACEKLKELRGRWWVLLHSDRKLLNQEENWLRSAPFINVQMWIHQIEAAQVRAEHLKETKGNDIRKYLRSVNMNDSEILSIRPIQIEHRKSKYGERIGCTRDKCILRFGPKGATRVAVAPSGKYKQLKLNIDGRTFTTRDAHAMGSHVK